MSPSHFQPFTRAGKIARVAKYPFHKMRDISRHYRRKNEAGIKQRLGEIVVNDVEVRVDEFGGNFFLPAKSDLLWRLLKRSHYEPAIVDCVKRYLNPARDAIDVGANVGFFSVLMAKHLLPGNSVLSIEPTQSAFDRLSRNVDLNDVQDSVHVHRGALSDTIADITINIIQGMEEYSSICAISHPEVEGRATDTETVPATTMDNIVEQYGLNPGFIKIDVEGAENVVFSGARNVLEKYRPVIVSELSDYLLSQNGSTAAQVVTYLEELNYQVSYINGKGYKPGEKAFGDIVAIPRESA